MLVAALLRIWAIGYDLPYIYHPDEPFNITISQRIFKTGDLNPHFFNYPSLFFYLNALAYVPYFLVGRVTGVFRTPHDIEYPLSLAMGVTHARIPSAILLIRAVSVGFGIGTVWLAYRAGRRLIQRESVGIVAALFTAISPIHVSHSRMATPDTLVTFFAVATFFASLRMSQRTTVADYVLAGLCAGATASAKYNGAVILLCVVTAPLIRHGLHALRKPHFYIALLSSAVGFFATTPYAVADYTTFIKKFSWEVGHYSSGHPGMEGNSVL